MAGPCPAGKLHRLIRFQNWEGLRRQLAVSERDGSPEDFHAYINAMNEHGLTPINAAIQWEQYPAVDVLLEAGADILRPVPVLATAAGPDGFQTLVANNREEQLDRLLCVLAKVMVFRRGWGPARVCALFIAALEKACDMGSVLLTIPLLTQEAHAELPEHVRASWEQLRSILLGPTRVPVPSPSGEEHSVSHLAHAGRLDALRALLRERYSTVEDRRRALLQQNECMPYHMPAIVAAAAAGQTSLLQYLHRPEAEAELGFTITAGDFADTRDTRGWTAFTAAVRGWQLETVVFLNHEVQAMDGPFLRKHDQYEFDSTHPTYQEQVQVMALASQDKDLIHMLPTVGWYDEEAGVDPHESRLLPVWGPSRWCTVAVVQRSGGSSTPAVFDVLRDGPAASLFACAAYHWLGTANMHRLLEWMAQVAWEQSGRSTMLCDAHGLPQVPVHDMAQVLCDIFQCTIQLYGFVKDWESMELQTTVQPRDRVSFGSGRLQGQTLHVLEASKGQFHLMKMSSTQHVMAGDGRHESTDSSSTGHAPVSILPTGDVALMINDPEEEFEVIGLEEVSRAQLEALVTVREPRMDSIPASNRHHRDADGTQSRDGWETSGPSVQHGMEGARPTRGSVPMVYPAGNSASTSSGRRGTIYSPMRQVSNAGSQEGSTNQQQLLLSLLARVDPAGIARAVLWFCKP